MGVKRDEKLGGVGRLKLGVFAGYGPLGPPAAGGGIPVIPTTNGRHVLSVAEGRNLAKRKRSCLPIFGLQSQALR